MNRLTLTHRRLKGLLVVLVVVVIAGLGWGAMVRREVLAWLVVKANVPAPEAVEELVNSYPDPIPFLLRLWNTGRIGHRQLAIEMLSGDARRRRALDPRTEKVLIAGAHDPDASIREIALGVLAERSSAALLPAARAQLVNPDPQIRLLGIQYLRHVEPRDALPSLAPLLDDPDLRVVTSVEAAFRQLTSVDFGVRISQSVPKPREDGREGLEPADLESIRSGVARRKGWWLLHAKEYNSNLSVAVEGKERVIEFPPAADFALEDLNGQSVRLSSLRGEVVVLNFWATWCRACVGEMADLIELQKRHTNRVVILGISLDGVPDEHGHSIDHESGVSSSAKPESDHENATQLSREELRSKLGRVVKARGITYRVLLDPENEVGARFNGGELPTNVLIDAEGKVRRRFVGARPLAAWEAMLSEISHTQ